MTGKAFIAYLCLSVLAAGAGCTGPSKGNIDLRKQNQQLQTEIDQLKRQRQGDLDRIRGLEQSTAVKTLPQVQLDRLYTAHGLSFGKLTGGYRNDPASLTDDGITVHVVPTDQEGETLKAAGSFDISVFDLAIPEHPLVARRHVSLDEARKNWYGQALLFNYVLKVPFEKRPEHGELLVRVEFADALTGRKITAERQVTAIVDSSARTSAAP
jgi:hypothetical protein